MNSSRAGRFWRFRIAVLAWALVSAGGVYGAESFDSVHISELLVRDRGDRPGWIELHNGGSETVSLGGWSLSDTPTNLTKWRFPRVFLLPDSYMVVSASGTNRTNDLAHLHTSFSQDLEGGRLLLSDSGTNVISEIVYPKSAANISYGCVRGEPAVRGSFTVATPGKANQSSGAGFAPKVVFSEVSGSFTNRVQLSFSLAAPENSADTRETVIRYTLDGSMPNGSSRVYREPLVLTNSACVRARAYQEGLLPGPPGNETYVQLAPDVLEFRSNLPVLVMDTLGLNLSTSQRSQYVHLSFYEPAEGKTSLMRQPTLATRGGFHVRGSSSAGMPQPSFALDFLDEFDGGESRSPLGLPSDSDWVLYAPNVFDSVLIHNPFIHQLSREMGRYSPRTRFLEVYVAQHPGPVTAQDYFGLYVLEEKIKIGKHRVHIDRLGPEDLQAPEVTGGYLVKFDRTGPGESGFFAGGASMVYVDPKESVMDLPQRARQRAYLNGYLNRFETVLLGSNWKDTAKGYRAYIDVDSWIDFHVLETLSGNVDVFNFSTFFYKPRGGKITFGPHWDFDRALGSVDHRDRNPRRWNTGPFFDAPWWSQIFTDPDFWQLWVDRWQDLRSSHFSRTNLFTLIDKLADEVREAQPRETDRWGLEPRGGSYQSEIDWMKEWLTERIDFIDQQLTPSPRLSLNSGPIAPGTKVTLTGTEGATLYYTLDGSDPRSSQGAISTHALIYSEPITLDGDARLMARARNPARRQLGGPPISTPWSGPVRANFTLKAP